MAFDYEISRSVGGSVTEYARRAMDLLTMRSVAHRCLQVCEARWPIPLCCALHACATLGKRAQHNHFLQFYYVFADRI